MMVLRDTLAYDSENWSAFQPFPMVSLFLCLGPSFIGAVISGVIQMYLLRCLNWQLNYCLLSFRNPNLQATTQKLFESQNFEKSDKLKYIHRLCHF